MEIRVLQECEFSDALALVLDVFMEFEAPVYSSEGIETFKTLLKNKQAISSMIFFGAFDKGKIVGVLAMRNSNHISLFFVKKEYHQKGIGKALFNFMLKNTESDNFTVNSSPYAVSIYEKLGFKKLSEEQIEDGIRFTPLKYKKQ